MNPIPRMTSHAVSRWRSRIDRQCDMQEIVLSLYRSAPATGKVLRLIKSPELIDNGSRWYIDLVHPMKPAYCIAFDSGRPTVITLISVARTEMKKRAKNRRHAIYCEQEDSCGN